MGRRMPSCQRRFFGATHHDALLSTASNAENCASSMTGMPCWRAESSLEAASAPTTNSSTLFENLSSTVAPCRLASRVASSRVYRSRRPVIAMVRPLRVYPSGSSYPLITSAVALFLERREPESKGKPIALSRSIRSDSREPSLY